MDEKLSKVAPEKRQDVSPAKSDERVSRKDESSNQENLVHDTAGGEMPDPQQMPSKSQFHSDSKRDV